MRNQKLDTLLNLALESSEEEREKSLNLEIGYDQQTELWDVIIKYVGEIEELQEPNIRIQPLHGNFAIVTLPQNKIQQLSQKENILYIEKPKRLYFQISQGKAVSCISQVQRVPYNLTGRGVLIGIADSGVDYRHPDFCTSDRKSRILKIWDQSARNGTPPQGYQTGAEYTKQQIDEALTYSALEGYSLVPERDLNGHGTQVLGIAAGNGTASGGVQRGAAYESEILAVKLGILGENSFPRTTELMLAVDYLVRESIRIGKPMAINISFGNNYGSHMGDSLLEEYLDAVASEGKITICVGTGNNAALPLHTSGFFRTNETEIIEISISDFEPTINIQLWKSYTDSIEIELEAPSGKRIGPFSEQQEIQRFRLDETEVLIYYGKPSPFMLSQEIYLEFLPKNMYINAGLWKIRINAKQIKNGEYHLWLPGGGILASGTGFAFSTPEGTITIPATAGKIISVGAYNSWLNTYADFSGRGFQSNNMFMKPDIAAPGVDITTTTPGNLYTTVTGTSFATPFVTGAAALLMQWGIINGNDPFLYGEKVKAYLRRGARPLSTQRTIPDNQLGYGTLCLKNSLPM